jgi:hypothetical protein
MTIYGYERTSAQGHRRRGGRTAVVLMDRDAP